ncbi:hypothetical protein [Natronobacterium texcoconense]|uniref:Uncharacterized protein n=1 Tax=Natronobacterium texcoconense TaxID=1095778 RepID=A0A1H1IS54_NATTX|nr:hypothetical protein [Natronobacterium texcoconense]SDR40522.1 hypothetical protein SAMN04489842_3776 [Natronobacterium texcoconense]
MDDEHGRRPPSRLLLVVFLATVVALPVAVTQLEVSPHRVTVGTVVVATLLLIGTIALPALILTRWRAADRDEADFAGRRRR